MTIEGFSIKRGNGTIKVQAEGYAEQVCYTMEEVGEYLYNMAPNNDIGNRACQKFAKHMGMNYSNKPFLK